MNRDYRQEKCLFNHIHTIAAIFSVSVQVWFATGETEVSIWYEIFSTQLASQVPKQFMWFKLDRCDLVSKKWIKLLIGRIISNHGHNILRLLMFYQLLLSPQVKQSAIISN